MFGVPRPRKSKAPLPSGVRSVSPMTTVVMASNGALSSSATICRYAVKTCALAEIALARANQNRVVGMNLNP